MAKCKNCRCYDRQEKWCDLVEDSPHEEMERDCDRYEKMTNADRIRSMTDEELAEMLMCPAEYDINFSKTCVCRGEMNRNCFECTKKWLQSEVEG